MLLDTYIHLIQSKCIVQCLLGLPLGQHPPILTKEWATYVPLYKLPNCWQPLCYKAFSGNAIPRQQHWAYSFLEAAKQPLIRDWSASSKQLWCYIAVSFRNRGDDLYLVSISSLSCPTLPFSPNCSWMVHHHFKPPLLPPLPYFIYYYVGLYFLVCVWFLMQSFLIQCTLFVWGMGLHDRASADESLCTYIRSRKL